MWRTYVEGPLWEPGVVPSPGATWLNFQAPTPGKKCLFQVYLLDLRQNQSLHLGASKTMQHETNGMVFAADGESLWLATGGAESAPRGPTARDSGEGSVTQRDNSVVSSVFPCTKVDGMQQLSAAKGVRFL